MNKEVAERIRVLRVSKNLSQENMAHELELSVGAYSNIERGKTDLTLTRLSQIAQVLDTDVQSLIAPYTKNRSMENLAGYGFATRNEVEELRSLIMQLQKEVKKLALKK